MSGAAPAAPGPDPAAPPRALAPYRLLFPLGALFAVAGTAPWLLVALGAPGYPAALHRMLMMQGFELSFVLGFLLTSIPAFTRGEPCRPGELAAAVAGQVLFGAFALAGAEAAAHLVFVATLIGLAIAAGRRVLGARVAPPEEFLFVGLGLALGIAGGLVQLAVALGAGEPSPRLGVHLVSLGMVLALVLGVGSILVPVFAGIRDPLVLPGIAGPHQRRNRRTLYLALAAALAGSFGLEAAGLAAAGAWLRLAAAAALGVLGWKLVRAPGRKALVAWALWASGWMMLAGLALAALVPARAIAFHHLVFVGGYGMLTLAIGARVVTGHGRWPVTDEAKMVTPLVVATLAAATLLRITAELGPRPGHALGAAAALWIVAWIAWAAAAFPRIARMAPPPEPARYGIEGLRRPDAR